MILAVCKEIMMLNWNVQKGGDSSIWQTSVGEVLIISGVTTFLKIRKGKQIHKINLLSPFTKMFVVSQWMYFEWRKKAEKKETDICEGAYCINN